MSDFEEGGGLSKSYQSSLELEHLFFFFFLTICFRLSMCDSDAFVGSLKSSKTQLLRNVTKRFKVPKLDVNENVFEFSETTVFKDDRGKQKGKFSWF